jgi:hypothetical protein
MNNTPENLSRSHEEETAPNPELERASLEQREALRAHHELSSEAPEQDVQNLHEKALEHAESAVPDKEDIRVNSPAERRSHGPISRKERDASFKTTMTEVQTHMSPKNRAFSKVIHNKAIEKVSETTSNTVARPNAILSGAIAAFIVTLSVYLLAKNYGYPLSGFESIAAFALGWIVGLVYDFFKVMITGRA